MRVLIVVAHPDDAALSLGIKIQHHLTLWDEVFLHCLSSSCASNHRDAALYRGQQYIKQVATALDIDDYSLSPVMQGSFLEQREVIKDELNKYVALYAPDLLYTHFPSDLNYDHVVTAQEALTAAKEIPSVVYFRSSGTRHFRPNLLVLWTPFQLQRKIEAIRCAHVEWPCSEMIDDLPIHSASVLFEYLPHHLLYKRQQEGKEYFGELLCVERQVSIWA